MFVIGATKNPVFPLAIEPVVAFKTIEFAYVAVAWYPIATEYAPCKVCPD